MCPVLTPEQWATARRRWEGDPRAGFEWLTREIRAAFQVTISRAAVSKMATKRRWAKQGPQSAPLPPAEPDPTQNTADAIAALGKAADALAAAADALRRAAGELSRGA